MKRRVKHAIEKRGAGHSFAERWPNAKAARVGYLTARCYTAPAIAEALGDGTTAETVRTMWAKWGLEVGRGRSAVPVNLSLRQRSQLTALSRKIGITPDEWLRRVVEIAIKDDLYLAIVGDDE